MFRILTDEQWQQVRYEFEYTDKPVDQIALDWGVSVGTIRNRRIAWGWTSRRPPVPPEGPPRLPAPQIEAAAPSLVAPGAPVPRIEAAAPLLLPAPQGPPLAPMHVDDATPSPGAPPGAELAGDPDTPTALRLQGAVASVLAAIEAIVAKIGAARLGESDRSARALAALTRTLRELNTLQSQYEEPAADDSPADIDEFRFALARKIDAFVAAQGGGVRDDAEPEGA